MNQKFIKNPENERKKDEKEQEIEQEKEGLERERGEEREEGEYETLDPQKEQEETATIPPPKKRRLRRSIATLTVASLRSDEVAVTAKKPGARLPDLNKKKLG